MKLLITGRASATLWNGWFIVSNANGEYVGRFEMQRTKEASWTLFRAMLEEAGL